MCYTGAKRQKGVKQKKKSEGIVTMDNFEFYSPTRFVFGRGAEEKTGTLVRKYGGTKALLHFGGGSMTAHGVSGQVVA